MTWPEVADTAIKIGLGAAVAAIGSFAVVKTNQRHDLRKETLRRKRDSLEKIVENFDSIHGPLMEKAGRMLSFRRSLEAGRNTSYTRDNAQRIAELIKESPHWIVRLYSLESRLRLMGCRTASKTVHEYITELVKVEKAMQIDSQREEVAANVYKAFEKLEEKRSELLNELGREFDIG